MEKVCQIRAGGGEYSLETLENEPDFGGQIWI